MCSNQHLKFLFLILTFFCLSSCASTSDDIFSEIDQVFSSDEQPVIVPQGPAYNKPVVVMPKDYNNTMQSPVIKTPKKPMIKKPVLPRVMAKKSINKPCIPEKFLNQNSISNIYKIYLKENKSCILIKSSAVASAMTVVLSNHYLSQDIRLLNADQSFLGIYASAVKYSDQADKVALNKQIVANGCHLLKPYTCSIIKKSLY